jgi:transcription antitermination factor NusG
MTNTYEYNKQYRNLHRERLLRNKREIYKRDKERISKESKVKVRCICGAFIGVKGTTKHLKSQKHAKTLTDQFFN